MIEYYSAIKKDFLPIIITLMNLVDVMLSKISQTQKNQYDTMISYAGSKTAELIEPGSSSKLPRAGG